MPNVNTQLDNASLIDALDSVADQVSLAADAAGSPPGTVWVVSCLLAMGDHTRSISRNGGTTAERHRVARLAEPLARDEPFYIAIGTESNIGWLADALDCADRVVYSSGWDIERGAFIVLPFSDGVEDRINSLYGSPQEVLVVKIEGLAVERRTGDSAPEGVVVLEQGDGLILVTLEDELLQGLPATARQYAQRYVAVSGHSQAFDPVSGTWQTISNPGFDSISAETLRRTALNSWRAVMRARMRSPQVDEAFEERRAAHRAQSAQRLAELTRRPRDTEEHVSTLPFVPHGLASSRRWGIEVESAGARGVTTPIDWRSVSDGSLRSAYEGWVEVQDFEPFDEEVTTVVHPNHCNNGNDHNYLEERRNPDSGNWEWVINEQYMNPAECEGCGEITTVVHREPQTITHYAESGDCREYVSPILISMHSRGLEHLTEQLSVRPQNDSAGVHVHVEASDLNEVQIATLMFGYDFLEPILEASYRRNEREYCRRQSAARAQAAARFTRRGDGPFDLYDQSRYVTLNTHALREHGTIEFRAMGPVYEYDYLVRWAMLCRELVNVVANGATTADFSRVRSWRDLVALLVKFGKEYVRALTYELTGETGEAARLEKAGEFMTTEALDEDLSQLLAASTSGYGISSGTPATITPANLGWQAELLGQVWPTSYGVWSISNTPAAYSLVGAGIQPSQEI